MTGPTGPTGPRGPTVHHAEADLGPSGPDSVSRQDSVATKLRRKPEHLVELDDLKKDELETISERLGRMSKRERARAWKAAALLLFGGAIGGLFGLLGLVEPSEARVRTYWLAIAIAVVVALICLFAANSVEAERADSVQDIKKDLDKILGTYEEMPS